MVKLSNDVINVLKDASNWVAEHMKVDVFDYLRHNAELEYRYVLETERTEEVRLAKMSLYIWKNAEKFVEQNKGNAYGIEAIDFVVFKSFNDLSRDFYTFHTLDDARKFYRGMLKDLFWNANTDVDDNGEDIDTCVQQAACLLDDHYHGIDIAFRVNMDSLE